MRFKDFEIRPTTYLDGKKRKNRYDVVKWKKADKPFESISLETGEKGMTDTYCFSVAHIYWNEKEPCWEFESVGTRFLEYYEEGLAQFVYKFIEVLDWCREVDDDEGN